MLLPYMYAPVFRAGGKELSELRVRPGKPPDAVVVRPQDVSSPDPASLPLLLLCVEDGDSFVHAAGRESFPMKVKAQVVDHIVHHVYRHLLHALLILQVMPVADEIRSDLKMMLPTPRIIESN